MKQVIAIFTSDWHWWQNAPVFRSAEENWLEAQSRPLEQIKEFQNKNADKFGRIPPVVFAGDLFDHYNPNPAAINALLAAIPKNVVGIPGQHDLEHHVLANIEKTGFYTLVQSGAIYFPESFGTAVQTLSDKCNFYFCPWGVDIENVEVLDNGKFNVLVAHKYVWFDDSTKYGGEECPGGKLSGLKSVLQKFDYAVFGDNHIPFRKKIGKCQVINCGTMNRRKLDEREYETGFTALYDDGEIEFTPFDNIVDKVLTVTCTGEKDDSGVSTREFFNELNGLKDCEVDFQDQVNRKANETEDKKMIATFAEIFNSYEA